MIDPDQLMLKAVAEALDESGLAPSSSAEDAKAFLKALWDSGYEVVKVEEEEEEEEEE